MGAKLPGDKVLFAVLPGSTKCPHLCNINQTEQRGKIGTRLITDSKIFMRLYKGNRSRSKRAPGPFSFMAYLLI